MLSIPCGCDSRKEVMYTSGNLGIPEVAIAIGIATVLIICLTKGIHHV